jgi:diguanylate cyclase (GGDEF)-like protein
VWNEAGLGILIGIGLSLGGIVLEHFFGNLHWAENLIHLWLVLTMGVVGFSIGKLFRDVKNLSITDPLTGLYSRYYFFDQMDRELGRSLRFQHPFSVVMVDLDHFKDFNDRYGHLVGDRLLRLVADTITNAIRKTDVAGRFGGEEFVLLLPHADALGAEILSERLRMMVEKASLSRAEREEPLHSTISVGIATFPESGTTLEALLEHADQALYYAKKHGRNQVIHFRKLLKQAVAQ